MHDLARSSVKVYERPVDMFPLTETFGTDDACGSNFKHHASLVYTRAPLGDAQARKFSDGRRTLRANGSAGRQNGEWEDGEEALHRLDRYDVSSSYEKEMEMARLKARIDQLQHKLAVREDMLQAYRFGDAQSSSEVMALSRKVDELQRVIAEKEILWHTTKEMLAQKEIEVRDMQNLLHAMESSSTKLRAKNVNNEEELMALRCELASLRWQMEVADVAELAFASEVSCKAESYWVHEEADADKVEMEAARRMYMASLVVAGHVPQEACLGLVQELRMYMQSFLKRQTFWKSSSVWALPQGGCANAYRTRFRHTAKRVEYRSSTVCNMHPSYNMAAD